MARDVIAMKKETDDDARGNRRNVKEEEEEEETLWQTREKEEHMGCCRDLPQGSSSRLGLCFDIPYTECREPAGRLLLSPQTLSKFCPVLSSAVAFVLFVLAFFVAVF